MYYKYFRGVIKNQGTPQLNNDELTRLLDIAYIEGALNFLNQKRDKAPNTEERHKNDVDIYHLKKKLSSLLGGRHGDIYPKDVLNRMLVKSRS